MCLTAQSADVTYGAERCEHTCFRSVLTAQGAVVFDACLLTWRMLVNLVVVVVAVVVVVVVVAVAVAVIVITILTKYPLCFFGAILCSLAFCPPACLPCLLASWLSRLPALRVCLLAPSLAYFCSLLACILTYFACLLASHHICMSIC